ncbi:MAG: response regulator, partial [Ignavibacteriaceae bacterium]
VQEADQEQETASDTELEAEQELASDFEAIVDEIKNEEETDSSVSGDTPIKIDLSKLRCLYIEDQVDSQILFKVQMKELKEIKFAVSFEEALPLLDSDSFDFIVMDINLQGEYNGLDALKLIRKMPTHENVPIIAVTAYVLPGDKEKFIATGFSEFISKPIFKEKMLYSLMKIFSAEM